MIYNSIIKGYMIMNIFLLEELDKDFDYNNDKISLLIEAN
jgi:hypothetical protein